MKTKRLAPSHYELTATSTLDGAPCELRAMLYRELDIPEGPQWILTIEIDGKVEHAFGAWYRTKRDAQGDFGALARDGLFTHPAYGICAKRFCDSN